MNDGWWSFSLNVQGAVHQILAIRSSGSSLWKQVLTSLSILLSLQCSSSLPLFVFFFFTNHSSFITKSLVDCRMSFFIFSWFSIFLDSFSSKWFQRDLCNFLSFLSSAWIVISNNRNNYNSFPHIIMNVHLIHSYSFYNFLFLFFSKRKFGGHKTLYLRSLWSKGFEGWQSYQFWQ